MDSSEEASDFEIIRSSEDRDTPESTLITPQTSADLTKFHSCFSSDEEDKLLKFKNQPEPTFRDTDIDSDADRLPRKAKHTDDFHEAQIAEVDDDKDKHAKSLQKTEKILRHTIKKITSEKEQLTMKLKKMTEELESMKRTTKELESELANIENLRTTVVQDSADKHRFLVFALVLFILGSLYFSFTMAIRPMPPPFNFDQWEEIGKLENELHDAMIIKKEVEKYCESASKLKGRGVADHREWVRMPPVPESCSFMKRRVQFVEEDFQNLEKEFTAYRLKIFLTLEVIWASICGVLYYIRDIFHYFSKLPGMVYRLVIP